MRGSRKGPTLRQYFFKFMGGVRGGEEGSKYHYKRVITGPQVKRLSNGVSLMAFRCRADDGPTLNASLVAS